MSYLTLFLTRIFETLTNNAGRCHQIIFCSSEWLQASLLWIILVLICVSWAHWPANTSLLNVRIKPKKQNHHQICSALKASCTHLTLLAFKVLQWKINMRRLQRWWWPRVTWRQVFKIVRDNDWPLNNVQQLSKCFAFWNVIHRPRTLHADHD